MMTLMLDILDEQELSTPAGEASFGAVRTEQGHLPLKAMAVNARIIGLHYRATLTQTFVNAFLQPLEAIYVFPLPHRAGVNRFRMKVADREIDGVLKEKNAARREYQEAVQQGYRAALAEEERPNVFSMKAGNIAPGEALSVELELSGPLDFADGEATFRFPLVVAPRYFPAATLRDIPESGTLLPGMPNPVHLGLRVGIDDAGLPLTSLRSSLHQVRLEEYDDQRVVSLRPGVERLDRDFILRLGVGSDKIVAGVSHHRREGERESTVAVTLVPPELSACGIRPRDVVVVLDRSGSMAGWKMVAARRAAARIVDSLTARDRFAVLAFDDVVETVPDLPEMACAEDGVRARAVEYLSRIDARGGTEMDPAFDKAVARLAGSEDRERAVVVITDGQVGNERSLLHRVQQARGVRFHTVGIDRAVNAAFLEQIGRVSGGSSDLVESESRLEEVMRRIHHRVGRPVLRDVSIELPGLKDVSPAGPIDLYPGTPVVVAGRYGGGKLPDSLEVVGKVSDVAEYRTRLAVRECSDPVLETAWARARVLDLEHRFQIDGGKRLEGEITAFSLRWGVLSRFTAFVAVDRSEVVPGRARTLVQPLETPSGWGATPPLAGRLPGPLMCRMAPAPAAGVESAWLGAEPAMDCCMEVARPEPAPACDLFGAPAPCAAFAPTPAMGAFFCPPPAPPALPDLAPLLALDPRKLRLALDRIAFDELVAALVGCDPAVLEHVCRALDPARARTLRQRQALEWYADDRVRAARETLLAAL